MNIAGHPIRYRFRETMAPKYFGAYSHPVEGNDFDICVSDDDIDYIRKKLPDKPDAYLECRYLIDLTARHLLQFGACIIHAAAFSWKGYAWLLAAPSGVGKSTQMYRWAQLFGAEIQVICGDMPAISAEPDGTIMVWPTPWNGKESWGGRTAAPLGGVLFLEQEKENSILRLEPVDVIFRYFRQFPRNLETAEQIHTLAMLIDRCASTYPAWLLKNRGDLESARLTAHTLQAYILE